MWVEVVGDANCWRDDTGDSFCIEGARDRTGDGVGFDEVTVRVESEEIVEFLELADKILA